MTTKQFLKSIFLNQPGSISSKRICGVRQYMDANGNVSYKDYNGDDIPGLIMKNGKPYIPAESTGDYFKSGGKLIKRQNNGIQRKFN